MACNSLTVLSPSEQECREFCPKGSKNFENICYSCSDNNCSELSQNDFKLTKTGPSQFRVDQLREVNNFDNNFKEAFNVNVEGAENINDYTYNLQSFP